MGFVDFDDFFDDQSMTPKNALTIKITLYRYILYTEKQKMNK